MARNLVVKRKALPDGNPSHVSGEAGFKQHQAPAGGDHRRRAVRGNDLEGGNRVVMPFSCYVMINTSRDVPSMLCPGILGIP